MAAGFRSASGHADPVGVCVQLREAHDMAARVDGGAAVIVLANVQARFGPFASPCGCDGTHELVAVLCANGVRQYRVRCVEQHPQSGRIGSHNIAHHKLTDYEKTEAEIARFADEPGNCGRCGKNGGDRTPSYRAACVFRRRRRLADRRSMSPPAMSNGTKRSSAKRVSVIGAPRETRAGIPGHLPETYSRRNSQT